MENMDMAMVEKIGVIGICLGLSYMMVKHIWSYLKIEKEPVTVLVTAATGEIGYALIPAIAQGEMLGKDQPIILHLHETEEASEALKAVQMELLDSAFPLLKGVVTTTCVNEAWKGVDVGIILDNLSPKERDQGREANTKLALLYTLHGSALDKHAADDCKVVVAGKAANTNALILKKLASSSEARNITCLTRHDHNRALGQISEKLGVHVSSIKNVVVWGNSSQRPDIIHALVSTKNDQRRVLDLMASRSDHQWLNGELVDLVLRGGVVFKARAFSTAKAICDHIHDWVHATPKGSWVSMGVSSDGSYGIEPGLFYSFPVTCHNGQWSIVQGLKINEFSRRIMDEMTEELAQQKQVAYESIRACMEYL